MDTLNAKGDSERDTKTKQAEETNQKPYRSGEFNQTELLNEGSNKDKFSNENTSLLLNQCDSNAYDFTHCSLREIPSNLQTSNCQQLLLRRDRLVDLPADLLLPQCVTLDLYDNLLTCIPECISNFHSCKSLDLSFNRIDQISLSQLPSALESLYAACNKIEKADELFARGKHNLKLMEFGGNFLKEIPFKWQSATLEELWLASNALKFQSLSLLECPRLRILALQSNLLEGEVVFELPESIRELWIANNNISLLKVLGVREKDSSEEEVVGKGIEKCSISCIHLDADKRTFPSEGSHQSTQNHPVFNQKCPIKHSVTFACLPNLKTLDIASNKFTVLPEWLPSHCPGLTDLDFKGNLIESLPGLLGTLSQLAKLETLWMRNNPATLTASNISRIYHSAKADWASKKVSIQDI
jgi:Leucine-rich repeat (LRR) protein